MKKLLLALAIAAQTWSCTPATADGVLGIIPVPACSGSSEALTWDGSKFGCHVIGAFAGPPPGQPPAPPPPDPPPPGSCTGASAGTSATPSGSAGYAGLWIVDKAWALPNGTTICKIGAFSNAAFTGNVFVAQRNAGGTYTLLAAEAFSHPGGGWADKTLAAPYTTPASGTVYAGAHWGTTTNAGTISSSYGFFNGTPSGTQSWTEGTGNALAVRASR